MKQISMDKLQALAKTNSQKAREATLRRKQEALQPELDRQLHTALGLTPADYGEVVKALDAGANPNSRVDGWSPMDTATYQRDHGAERERPVYERIVSLLVARGAKPEKRMEERARELIQAIDGYQRGDTEEILSMRVDPDTVVDGWTALGRAHYLINTEEAQTHRGLMDSIIEIIQSLERHGAKKSLQGEAYVAVPKKRDNRLERARKNQVDRLIVELHRAIPREGPAKIEQLVTEIVAEKGDLDRLVNDWTALGISTYIGLPEISGMLRRHGASRVVNPHDGAKEKLKGESKPASDARELIRIILAANDEPSIVETAGIYLKRGIDMRVTEEGWNVLGAAYHRGFSSLSDLIRECELNEFIGRLTAERTHRDG
jgi:hypothetical protein